MRTWKRADRGLLCGACPERITRTEPYLELRFRMIGNPTDIVKIRCGKCAGESVPGDLPPLPDAKGITPTSLLRLDKHSLPLDWKTAAAGDREPGAEG